MSDLERMRNRQALIAAFQRIHAVLAANQPLTQQQLLEVLAVRSALLDVEADSPQDSLDMLNREVAHCVERFWAPDVAPEDEFMMTLMVSVTPKGRKRK